MKKTAKYGGRKLIVILTAVFLAALALILAGCSSNKAAVMRLIRTEGEVTLENASGDPGTAQLNARLNSGEKLRTGAGSSATVSLDDTKIASLDELSFAEFIKSGRALELHLLEGGVFFDVMEKLRDDETFDIKTSTMTIGIRGTSGYVRADSDKGEFWLTDGEVEVEIEIGGIKKKATVHSGEKLVVTTTEEGEPEVVVEKYEVEELPDFARDSIKASENDPGLIERILQANGWNVSVFDKSEPNDTETEPSTETEPEVTETEPEETEQPPAGENPPAEEERKPEADPGSGTGWGDLPAASQILLISLPVIWIAMGAFDFYRTKKSRRKN